ncbi:hypothetical protein TWF102_005158 [Orbilia oligospora]|uniref:Uncharacterized protein n=1 Tax=Orbilia oligospora TaxID=2813651 RepID=A0A7C8NHA1_ORBOL|nr:hypothetical protein TWF102_005158 [Orbilia oligospora]
MHHALEAEIKSSVRRSLIACSKGLPNDTAVSQAPYVRTSINDGRAAVATASRWVLTELKSTKARPEWWRILSPVFFTGAVTSLNDWVILPAYANLDATYRRSHDNTGIEKEVFWRESLLPPAF